MKLAVHTICSHLRFEERWWSYEPFVREMDIWSELFDELHMVAPLDAPGPPPPFWAPYRTSEAIRVIPYRRDRGRGLDQARTAPVEVPRMIGAIARAARSTDACHVRCPGSIGLLGAIAGPLIARRRVAKYAGQWSDYAGEPRSFRFQKRLLASGWWRAPVTVYGDGEARPSHVRPFFTTAMTEVEMERARRVAAERRPPSSPRVLFVGRLSASKNVAAVIEAVALAGRDGCPLCLSIVGDGPERRELERMTEDRGLAGSVTFTGSLPTAAVHDLYARSDVLVLASRTEGWPKAIAEAMAFGLVCIGSRRGIVPWMLEGGRGLTVPPGDAAAIAGALLEVATDPQRFVGVQQSAARWAHAFTLERLRDDLRALLSDAWSLPEGTLVTGSAS